MADTAGTTGAGKTGGPTGLDPFMLTPETPDEQAKWDAELEKAFGPQGTQAEEDEDTQDGTQDNEGGDTGDQGADTNPNTGASVEGEGEGGEGETAPSGAIGGDTADFAALFRNRYNRDPEPGELEGYIQLAEWAAQLTPQQQAAINAAMENPERFLAPQYQQPQPTQQQAPVTPTVDPDMAALIEEYGEDHPLVKRLQVIEQNQSVAAQQSIQQQQERTLEDINKGVTSFHTRYADLSQFELDNLQGAVAQSRMFPGFVQAHGGDIAKATEAALDYVYWQTPTFRQRETEKQYAAMEEAKKQEATRKAKASAVSGSGGNGASRTAPPPKTNDDRWAAVSAGLSEAMNGAKND